MSSAKEFKAKPYEGKSGYYEISGYKGYAASRAGKILNKKTGHETLGGDAGRYLRVSVYRDGAKDATLEYVHDLVCIAFKGPRPAGMKVMHANNKRFDNRATNLEWGTQGDNITQTYKDGLRKPANQHTVAKESHMDFVTESIGSLARAFGDILISRKIIPNDPILPRRGVDLKVREQESSLLEMFLNIDSSGVVLTEDQTTLFMSWLDSIAQEPEKYAAWQAQTLIHSKPTYVRIELSGYYGGLLSTQPRTPAEQIVSQVVKQVRYVDEAYSRYRESYEEEVFIREAIYNAFAENVDRYDDLTQIQAEIFKDLKDLDALGLQKKTSYQKRLQAVVKPFPFFGQVNRVLVTNQSVLKEPEVPKTKTAIAVRGSDLAELNRCYKILNDLLARMESQTANAHTTIHPSAYPFRDAGKNQSFADLYRAYNNGVNFLTVNQYYIERAQALRSVVSILRGLLYFSDTVLKR